VADAAATTRRFADPVGSVWRPRRSDLDRSRLLRGPSITWSAIGRPVMTPPASVLPYICVNEQPSRAIARVSNDEVMGDVP